MGRAAKFVTLGTIPVESSRLEIGRPGADARWESEFSFALFNFSTTDTNSSGLKKAFASAHPMERGRRQK